MDSNIVNKSVEIHAQAAVVWKVLTEPDLMQQWMSDDRLDIRCDWTLGGAMVVRGEMHGHVFENKGTILAFDPDNLLRYTYLSSLSKLPDREQNYSVIEFALAAEEDKTILKLTQHNFITLTNYKHFDFYWNVTLRLIRQLSERDQ
jgi:uncharacterized protein YndB with AHSA1/START domain